MLSPVSNPVLKRVFRMNSSLGVNRHQSLVILPTKKTILCTFFLFKKSALLRCNLLAMNYTHLKVWFDELFFFFLMSFDIYIHPWNHHQIRIRNISLTPEFECAPENRRILAPKDSVQTCKRDDQTTTWPLETQGSVLRMTPGPHLKCLPGKAQNYQENLLFVPANIRGGP